MSNSNTVTSSTSSSQFTIDPTNTDTSPPSAHDSTLTATPATATTNDAATKLAEALDDFLSDVERKFKGVSDEILTRLDEMTERCDRLEGELLRREVGRSEVGGKPVGGVVDGDEAESEGDGERADV